MRSHSPTPFTLILAVSIGIITSTLVGAAESSCLTCHKKEKDAFVGSAHEQAGVTCLDCHGGNPKDPEKTAHIAKDFRRPDNKRAIAEGCATCHSDVRRMNPFGLPTDQLERYKTSKHGEQLFEHNDQKVATCTDCHGAHDILKVKSPQSRTHPTHIPETCGRCHSDAKLMGEYKLSSDAVEKYKTSYHAHMVLEKGDLSAPTCVTCHGNHGAVPPGAQEVGQVCGKCHVRQKELFAKSPHAEAASVGAFNECVNCHGNHAIQKASVELFAQRCVECHSKDEKPLAVRDAVVAVLKTAKAAYERASARVQDATVHGLATEDEQLLLQDAKTQVTQLEAMQHTLAPDQLRPPSARTEEIAANVQAGINLLEQVERRKRNALVPMWSFLAAMAIIFWAKRRQLELGKK